MIITVLIGIICGILGGLLGSFFYENRQNKTVEISNETIKREAPKNISGISDPLESYNRYKDEVSKLYRPIKREVVNRLEIGNDDDSK